MACEKKTETLVSVVVITYNSAQFVLETLDSIDAQTYRNLELIITDDCSKDNTVELCRDWLARHQERFVRTELLTVTKNTGIAGNCNRGYAAAKGEWIKGIAGDDILYPQCIEKGMDYAQKTGCKIFTVSMQEFGAKHGTMTPPYQWENATVPEQLDMFLTQKEYIAAPGLFCRKEIWSRCEGFDPRYPLQEDIPFFFKVLQTGEKIFSCNEILVKYRVYPESVYHSHKCRRDWRNWARDCLIPAQLQNKHYFYAWHCMVYVWKENHGYTGLKRKLLAICCIIINPLGFFSLCQNFFKKISGRR